MAVVVVVVLFVTGVIGGGSDTEELVLPDGEGTLTEEEISTVIDAVSDLIMVPTGEDAQPVVATITDAATLQSQQAFYQNAANDDILLIYPTIARAIIYRPSADMLINVGPVQVNNDQAAVPAAPAETVAPTPPAAVETPTEGDAMVESEG